MKEIKLKNNTSILIDDDDFELVSKYSWYSQKCGETLTRRGRFYAFTDDIGFTKSLKTKHTRMHKLIIKHVPSGMVIDHINGNGLDNRKCNLRVCTPSQNSMNSRKRDNCSSIYKGVAIDPPRNLFKANIRVNGTLINLGRFRNQVDAAIAYDNAAKIHFGEFAKLNFPEQ